MSTKLLQRNSSRLVFATLFCLYNIILLSPSSSLLLAVEAWQDLKYKSETTSDAWQETWSENSSDPSLGEEEGPRGRRGHSIVLYNSSDIIIFGGRDNDIKRNHVPKTYDLIKSNNSTMYFSTYEDKPIVQQSSLEDGTEIEIGLLYNDVWQFDLNCASIFSSSSWSGSNCTSNHISEEGSNEGIWKILHPGRTYGGCLTVNGTRECEVPSERFYHGASLLSGHLMMIYGGYSHECEDYCDDLWSFDILTKKWSQLNKSGSSLDDSTYVGPGKRWMFSLLTSTVDVYNNSNEMLILFGGHRLWQKSKYDRSGFLSDLWFYNWNVTSKEGKWQKANRKETCELSPGLVWELRNQVRCRVYWPSGRYGHAVAYDRVRHGFWLFGGFSSYLHHLSDLAGSSPDLPFYHDDLWFYNITSGFWKEIFPNSWSNPRRRTETVMALVDDKLIIHGGFGDNHYYNDTWYYYIEENRWLEKKQFVHENFRPSCTNDLEYIGATFDCKELVRPKELKRAEYTDEVSGIYFDEMLPFKFQDGYTPDEDAALYFGIVDDANAFLKELQKKYLFNEVLDASGQRVWIESLLPEGTPIAPFAATGPRQYARKVQLQYNDTTQIEVWEYCTSVKGEPTRGKLTDGNFGRAPEQVQIPQPRRQSAGWDGCQEFDWKFPSSRSGHAAVYADLYTSFIFYGGIGYVNPYINPATDISHEVVTMDDFWYYNVQSCNNDCSGHGNCVDGFCYCDDGFYGLDCSNITCPGSVCYYDKEHYQHCSHCCHDGHVHKDSDNYIPEVKKQQCKILPNGLFSGSSEGICDGFGSCQCAPPFVGDDCSIKDCKEKCNYNGHCSVEYPVSRCICNPGYMGESCEFKECLNNCSYPNGICDIETGLCTCSPIYDPYYDGEGHGGTWTSWQGEDCSFLQAWSSGPDLFRHYTFQMLTTMVVTSTLILMEADPLQT